jgi:hypothetical protein
MILVSESVLGIMVIVLKPVLVIVVTVLSLC